MDETEYQAALEEVNRLWDCVPDTPEGKRLDSLVMMIQEYEQEYYPMRRPDIFAFISYRLESRRKYAGWPTWLRHLLVVACDGASSFLSLVRDFCTSVYASYPAAEVEEAEEEFVIMLGWNGER